MSDPDRGVYTPPTDEPLSFDARRPVRGARPVPLTLIVSGVVLVLLVVAIVFFYRGGARQAGEAPRMVGEPVGAIKAEAPPETASDDPAAGLQIYRSETGEDAPVGQPSFTAPPEQPGPRPAPTSPAVVAQAPLPPAPVPTAPVLKGPVAAPPPAPAAAPPAPKAAPPAPKAAAPAAATPAAGGSAAVQIGAFSSQAQAEEGLAAAARIAPGAMVGRGRQVTPIDRNGQTLYRTAVTGFASRAEATAFCDQLKAGGKTCFVR